MSHDQITRIERQFVCFMLKSINGLVKNYKRKQRRLQKEQETPYSEHTLQGKSTCALEDTNLQDIDLYELFQLLPISQRKVADLIIVRDLTEQQAAELLGVSQQYINKQKQKAFHKLRCILLSVQEIEG